MPARVNLANFEGLSSALTRVNLDDRDVSQFIKVLQETIPRHPHTDEYIQLRINPYPIATLIRNRQELGLSFERIAHIAVTISHDGPCDFDACDGTFYFAGGFLECDINPDHRRPILAQDRH